MTTSASPASRGRATGHRDTCRGLVVRPCDDVDRRVALRVGSAAGIGLDDDRVADEGVLGDRGGEFGAELAVGSGAATACRSGRTRRRPRTRSRRRCPAPPRSRRAPRRIPQPGADPADQVLDRRLPVRRAEQRGGAGGQGLQLLGSDLRGAGSEASVAGFDVVGDCELVSHAHQVSDPAKVDFSAGRDRADVTAVTVHICSPDEPQWHLRV